MKLANDGMWYQVFDADADVARVRSPGATCPAGCSLQVPSKSGICDDVVVVGVQRVLDLGPALSDAAGEGLHPGLERQST